MTTALTFSRPWRPTLVWLAISALALGGCNLVDIEITSPANGAEVVVGESVTIEVSIGGDRAAEVREVAFYQLVADSDAVLLGRDTRAPYQATWTPAASDLGDAILQAVATDADGKNLGLAFSEVTVVGSTSGDDTVPPSVPTSVQATAVDCESVRVNWNASTDSGGSGLKGYNVYRNGAFIRQVAAPATSLNDTGLGEKTSYNYRLVAVDNAANISAHSSIRNVTTPMCGREGIEEMLIVHGVVDGAVNGLAVDANSDLVALISEGKDLALVDRSRGTKTLIPFPGDPVAVELDAGVAYVAEEGASGSLTIRVVDARGGQSPAVAASISIPGRLGPKDGKKRAGLSLKNRILYFAGPTSALQLIDVREPWSPRRLDPLGLSRAAVKVEFDGDLGFMLDASGSILWFDASDSDSPSQPLLFRGSSAFDFAISAGRLVTAPAGDRAFVYDYGNSVTSPDLAVGPGNGVLFDGIIRSMAFSGSLVALRPSFIELRLFRVSPQLEFEPIAEIHENVSEFAIAGDELFFADWSSSSLRIFRIGGI